MQGLPTNPALASLAKELIQHLFASDPVYATAMGEHGFDHLLPAYDKDGRRKAAGGLASLLERLEGVGEDGLDAADRLDLKILTNGAKAALFDLEDERSWQYALTSSCRTTPAGNPLLLAIWRYVSPSTSTSRTSVRKCSGSRSNAAFTALAVRASGVGASMSNAASPAASRSTRNGCRARLRF